MIRVREKNVRPTARGAELTRGSWSMGSQFISPVGEMGEQSGQSGARKVDPSIDRVLLIFLPGV